MAADDPAGGEDRQIAHLLPPMRREYFELAIPLREYFEALRTGDQALRESEARFLAERDRRYHEVSAERDQRYAEVKAAEEKALKVKETADLKALDLASQIQTYKDEKANELREQISSERGLYVTRNELASAVRELQASIKPLTEYTAADAGRSTGEQYRRTEQRLDMGQLVAVVAVIVAILTTVLYAIKKLPVPLPRTPAALASRGAAMGYCSRCGTYAALDPAAMCGTCRRDWQPAERPGDPGYHAQPQPARGP